MPRPTIVRVVEIKRQIDLVAVILSDGKFAFRSKADLTQEQKDEYYSGVLRDVRNPFDSDSAGVAAMEKYYVSN